MTKKQDTRIENLKRQLENQKNINRDLKEKHLIEMSEKFQIIYNLREQVEAMDNDVVWGYQ